MNVLVVEDERNLADAIVQILEDGSYNAEAVYDGRAGLAGATSGLYDAIVLDVMLPGMSGTEIVHEMRRQQVSTPVLMLTAKASLADKVEGLDAGADDYMTKPFAIEELLARIRVALKKHRADTAQSTGARSAGKLHMEPASYSAGYGGEPINLTKKEFDLLNYLWQHENTAITRDDLLTNVWGYEFTGDTNIVDVYIRYLRQKIDDRFGIKTIHTIRAVGYMFRYEQE